MLDPKTKIKLVDKIVKYFDSHFALWDSDGNSYYDRAKINLILKEFGIGDASSNVDSLPRHLLQVDDNNIPKLYEYLYNDDNLSLLFHDKYAIEVLAEKAEFFNLNLYLKECLECINADRKIATAILLRCCVEIFINLFIKEGANLATKIEKFFQNFDNYDEFKIFNENNKQDELKTFLTGIRQFGNDVAHLNGKEVKDFIEKYDNKELLRLFCILIEHSILKEDIRKKNEENTKNSIKSIDFTIKEKPQTQYTSSDNKTINDNIFDDDEIPF